MDVLNQILREDRPGKLDQFFSAYGPAEASAMCFFVATCNTQEASSVSIFQAARHDDTAKGIQRDPCLLASKWEPLYPEASKWQLSSATC